MFVKLVNIYLFVASENQICMTSYAYIILAGSRKHLLAFSTRAQLVSVSVCVYPFVATLTRSCQNDGIDQTNCLYYSRETASHWQRSGIYARKCCEVNGKYKTVTS